MSTYEDICLQLEKRPKWQVVTYCICCAERTGPIIRRVGSEQAIALLLKLSDFLWSAPLRSSVKAEGSQWSKTIRKTPDVRCDDSGSPLYVSGDALAAFWYAIRAICSKSPIKHGTDLCYCMADITRGLDSPLSVSADPDPMPGPLEIVEFGAQQESLTILGSRESPTPELLSELRRKVVEASVHYERAIEEECARRGWLEAGRSAGAADLVLATDQSRETDEGGWGSATRSKEVFAALERQSRWQAIAYCAYCAEIVAPIIRQVGSEQVRELLGTALELIWCAPLRDEALAEASRIVAALQNTPDMRCQDAKLPLMEAGRALYSIVYALESIRRPDSVTYAKQAFIHALSVKRSVDEGSHLSEELAEHQRVLNMFVSEQTSTAEFLSELRGKAVAASVRFDEAMQKLRRSRGWP